MSPMKYALFLICCMTLAACVSFEDPSFFKEKEKNNFPKEIADFGKTLAKEFRQTVYNLNKQGVNYLDVENSIEFRKRFYSDWCNANSCAKKNELSINDLQLSHESLYEMYQNLTSIQIEFINYIIEEGKHCRTADDFLIKLLEINEDIYLQVPQIEQERLLFITAGLYYLINEFQILEQQGQMLILPYNNITILKTRSESGESGGFWNSCRQFISDIALIIGTELMTGEVVSFVTKIAGAAAFTIIVCLSLPGDTDYKMYCTDMYVKCVNSGGEWSLPNSGGYGKSMCDACREYCISQHVWDCPRPK